MTYYAGIDPGASGALVIIGADRVPRLILDRSAGASAWLEQLRIRKPCTVLELVGARRGNAANSMFSFGEQVGWIRAILELAGIAPIEVRPQAWQHSLIPLHADSKTNSYLNALRECPSGLWKGPRGAIRDGRTDAYNMALYAADNWKILCLQNNEKPKRKTKRKSP